MRLEALNPGTATHVIANADVCLTFDSRRPFPAHRIDALFGFRPVDLDDLVNVWALKRRPDLCIGAFRPQDPALVTLGEGVALDPSTSLVMKRVAKLTGTARVIRILGPDTWSTDVRRMKGRLPAVLYHGTSSVFRDGIVRHGLLTNQPPNWLHGGSGAAFLSATPQTAAHHARRTASGGSGSPIVVACRRPSKLIPDWDVERDLVRNPDVPSNDGDLLAREAGLWAAPGGVPPIGILAIYEPRLSLPPAQWRRVQTADPLRRLASWLSR